MITRNDNELCLHSGLDHEHKYSYSFRTVFLKSIQNHEFHLDIISSFHGHLFILVLGIIAIVFLLYSSNSRIYLGGQFTNYQQTYFFQTVVLKIGSFIVRVDDVYMISCYLKIYLRQFGYH